jgi:hypothetical protein
MPALRVTVDDDLAGTLAAEADRLGFDSRAAYVRWLLREREAVLADVDDAPAVDLSPTRVARPDDDAVGDAAARLGDVRRERVASPGPSVVSGDDRPGSDLADLDALDLPGHDDDLVERRRRLVGAAVDHLAEAGEARRSEFVDALYDARPAGYGSVDGWWTCVTRGLRQVARVRDADESTRTWRFRDVRGRVHVSDAGERPT